jgi:enoyl-CoA hydratase
MTPPVHTSVDGSVLVVTIDRPPVRNAVDRVTAELLVGAFSAFDTDDELAVAVLTGAGGTFCSGADLNRVAEGRGNRIEADIDSDGPMGPTRMDLSGGLELAVWCDLRVAASDSTLGVFCRRWGVPLVDGGTIRLPRLIGHGRAMDLILTGRGVGGAEALAIGLVDRLVAPGDALRAAVALAVELAALPQHCMRNDRRSAIDQWSMDLRSALEHETVLGIESIRSGDAIEGAARFASGVGRHGSPDS